MSIKRIIFAAIVALAACNSEKETKLPILGSKEPIEKVVNGEKVIDTIYQTIPDFQFLNQDSSLITHKNFDEKIYVADFFFTSCPGICPQMHRNMLKVYEKYKDHPEVKILSHSIDIKYDTPSRLKKYADKLGLQGNMWEFAHGSKEAIFDTAAKSYMVAVNEDKNAPGGFVHQGWFLLVDKDKRLRGAYEGTSPQQVEFLLEDMETLLKEYKN